MSREVGFWAAPAACYPLLMSDPDQSFDEYSPAETACRRDAAIRRALTTPPRPQQAEPRPQTSKGKAQRQRRALEKKEIRYE
jgi:hypothetical protein